MLLLPLSLTFVFLSFFFSFIPLVTSILLDSYARSPRLLYHLQLAAASRDPASERFSTFVVVSRLPLSTNLFTWSSPSLRSLAHRQHGPQVFPPCLPPHGGRCCRCHVFDHHRRAYRHEGQSANAMHPGGPGNSGTPPPPSFPLSSPSALLAVCFRLVANDPLGHQVLLQERHPVLHQGRCVPAGHGRCRHHHGQHLH